MGSIIKHEPVKLIIGLIGREELFQKAEKLLAARFGPVDFSSQVIDFTFTDYYEKEMGSGLKRKFLSFKRNIDPSALADIKRRTNEIEKRYFCLNNCRSVNIDPGYLSLSKLVLATTKDHQHRLYIGKGMFAEVTLRFRGRTFQKWEWTYPDYCTEEYIGIFNYIRNNLIMKKGGANDNRRCK